MSGVPRPSRALWIPFATVIALLAGLAVLPLVTATHVRRLRRQVSEHVAPARVAVDDLEAAIGVELYEGVAGRRAATPAERARGAEARASASTDVAALGAAVAPLDDAPARAALADLGSALATWHAGDSDARGLGALDGVLRDAAAEHAALAASAGLALSCRVDGAVDGAGGAAAPLWIDTDPARVHQVLGNLLSNACKYTPRGGCVELAGGAGPAGECWLAVRDSGPGVPPEAYERVFGEAVRLDGTRHIAGSGVGLAAARRVSRALGGDLTVGVAPQGGAAFVLRLPAHAA